jgi:hypothetical protein
MVNRFSELDLATTASELHVLDLELHHLVLPILDSPLFTFSSLPGGVDC